MKNSKPCEHCGLQTYNTPDNANAYGVYEYICEVCIAIVDADAEDE